MKNTYYITQRELYAYFASPIAFIMMAFFLFFSGLIFTLVLPSAPRSAELNSVMQGWANNVGIFLLLFVSIVTIRLIAEEQRTGTLELLLTSPVRHWQVVVGKYLATIVLLVLTLAFTFIYIFFMLVFGGRPDWGPLLSAYLGLLLVGSVSAALGILASSLTESQAVAAVISLLVSLILWFLGGLLVPEGPTESEKWKEDVIYASLGEHVNSFFRGSPEIRDILFYLTLTVLFLGITIQVVKMRRGN